MVRREERTGHSMRGRRKREEAAPGHWGPVKSRVAMGPKTPLAHTPTACTQVTYAGRWGRRGCPGAVRVQTPRLECSQRERTQINWAYTAFRRGCQGQVIKELFCGFWEGLDL